MSLWFYVAGLWLDAFKCGCKDISNCHSHCAKAKARGRLRLIDGGKA